MNSTRLLRASLRTAGAPRFAGRYSTKPSDPAPPKPHTPSQHPPPPKQPSRVGAFYRNNTYPVLKSFLLALFTYQLAYYAWLKLEVVEEKHEQQGTIRGLEEEVKHAVRSAKEKASGVLKEGVAEVKSGVEQTKKKGWWPW